MGRAPFTSKLIQQESSLTSCPLSHAHSSGGTTKTLELFTLSIWCHPLSAFAEAAAREPPLPVLIYALC